MPHLSSLRRRLSSERARLIEATTPAERALRTVWCEQLEREIRGELAFLGLAQDAQGDGPDISDDDLLGLLDPGNHS